MSQLIMVFSFPFIILFVIFIYSLILRKGWTFPRLKKIHDFVKLAMFYYFIFIVLSMILLSINSLIKKYSQMKIEDIFFVLTAIFLTNIVGKYIKSQR